MWKSKFLFVNKLSKQWLASNSSVSTIENVDFLVRSFKSDIHLTGQSNIETQNHVLQWPAYADLRVDKNINDDKDLIDYMKKVISIRDKLKIIK